MKNRLKLNYGAGADTEQCSSPGCSAAPVTNALSVETLVHLRLCATCFQAFKGWLELTGQEITTLDGPPIILGMN